MNIEIGSVWKGKHKDNAQRVARILQVDNVQVQLLHLTGRRSWIDKVDLLARYAPTLIHDVSFPEPRPRDLPPRRYTANAPLIDAAQNDDAQGEMPECSREGAEAVYGTLRQHQWEAYQIMQRFRDGRWRGRRVFSFVTPGGGKSGMIKLMIHEALKAGRIKRFLIVVPRKSLRRQMIDDLDAKAFGGQLLASNDLAQRPMYGYRIVVTTNQKLVREHGTYEKYMKEEPSMMFIDEAHHLAGRDKGDSPDEIDEADLSDDSVWKKKVAPAFNAALLGVCMSGTPKRGDGRPVPFLEYDENGEAKFDIIYGRAQALADMAIRSTSFRRMDGTARFERWFKEHETLLSEATRRLEKSALRTVLGNPEFRNWVMVEALKDWLAYRARTGHQSKAIVLAPSQRVAHELKEVIVREIGHKVALAISEKKGAHEELNLFRTKADYDVLVTVQMAYEGLDVPAATHLICLSKFRKEGWLEQAFARVTRIDRKCHLAPEEQSAFIYVPNDPTMIAFIERLCAEERCFLEERQKREGGAGEGDGAKLRWSTFRPIDAEPGDIKDGIDNILFNNEDQSCVDRARELLAEEAAGMSTAKLLNIGRKLTGWKKSA